jgi:hypothetical protein
LLVQLERKHFITGGWKKEVIKRNRKMVIVQEEFCETNLLVQLGNNDTISRNEGNVALTTGYFVFGIIFDIACLIIFWWNKNKYDRQKLGPQFM